MSEGRYDQRRKTDEHQRICKHIAIRHHIAHPPCREVDNLAVLTDAPIISHRRALCQFPPIRAVFLFLRLSRVFVT